jgi:hypothetical protein
MAHYPVNHRLRGAYRALAAVCGLYLLGYGIAGVIATSGSPFFDRGPHWVLGLRTNPAQAWLLLLLGLVIAAAAIVGGNLHHRVNLLAGWALFVLAIGFMTVMRTDVNVLNYSMVNVVVLLSLGCAVLCAALYGKVAPASEPSA